LLRAALAIVGAFVGAMVGSIMGAPFDVALIPVGAFAGYKLAPRRRRNRF